MRDSKEIVMQLEDSVRRLDKLADVLFYMMTIDERRSTLKETLQMVQSIITTLNDGTLYELYEQLVKKQNTVPTRYEQILQTDYNAFVKRLSDLWTELVVEANEADIGLRKYLNLDASCGIWGPIGWNPIAK